MLSEEILPVWSATQTRALLRHQGTSGFCRTLGTANANTCAIVLLSGCFHASQPAPPSGSLSPSSLTQHGMVG